jgi:hypothetical protein
VQVLPVNPSNKVSRTMGGGEAKMKFVKQVMPAVAIVKAG